MSFLARLLGRGDARLPGPPPFVADELVPLNPLEATLLRAVAGEQDMRAFLALLRHGHLFVPTEQEDATLVEGAPFRPILLEYPQGVMVAACTAGERVKALLPVVPGVRSGIVVEATWVLRNISDGLGLVLNAGWKVGLVLPSDGLRELKRDLGLA